MILGKVTLRWKLWNCCESFNTGNGENGGKNIIKLYNNYINYKTFLFHYKLAMEWTVGNHRTQIKSLSVRNSKDGEFVELERSWTNHFSAPYDPDNGNKLVINIILKLSFN